ncbi:MAG TPA: DUF5118 domain-containing protein, partial [Chitinophagaceae bacterium]|nr:DUF5118 domain-containing protein [Chitinophagaceae bacterium]
MEPLKRFALPALVLCLIAGSLAAQERRPTQPASTNPNPTQQPPTITPPVNRSGPKPYKDVITDKARTDEGLFKVHRVEEKYYFEIPDTLLGRDILVVNRISKAAAGMRNFFFGYAGDQIGNNVIRFEKGPNNRIFLKKISFDEMLRDTAAPMYRAVSNSNIQPIVATFDIAAFSRD